MTDGYNKRFNEIASWFQYHRKTITSLDKRCEFLEKSCSCLLELLARMSDEIEASNQRSSLYLPSGFHLNKPNGSDRNRPS